MRETGSVLSARTLAALLCDAPDGADWRLAPVVGLAQLGRCVDLQVESVENLGGHVVPAPERYAANLGRAMSDTRDVLVTIELAGQIVGFLWVSAAATAWHVNSVVLTASTRGKGLGAQVMRWLGSCALQAGPPSISLNYMRENARVAPFYDRLGFVLVGLDLEKGLEGAALPEGERLSKRLLDPGSDTALVDASNRDDELRSAFEQQRGTELPSVYHSGGRPVGAATFLLRRSLAGDAIAVSERFLVHPACTDLGVVHAMIADGERFARAGGARRAYVTLWQIDGLAREALLASGYRVGRCKVLARS